MKFKGLFRDWLLFSILIYILYETIWFITMHIPLLDGDYDILIIDFVYCAVFVFTGMTMCSILSHVHFFNRFDFWSQTRLCVVTLLGNLFLAYVFEMMYNRFSGNTDTQLFNNSLYIFSVVATFFSLLHHTERYFRIILRQKDELTELQKKLLKSKLDPHFVFNSLSTLAELIHESPAAAEQYTIKFSRIYRHLLATIDDNYVTIGESLELVKDYVDLQKYRVDGNIDLYVNIQDKVMAKKLFPLTLQTLVENAIKHNAPQSGETLYISILQLGTNDIVVGNSIGKCSKDCSSMGIGLETLRERYRLDHLPEPVVKEYPDFYKVRISTID